jgi:hypothetical protein
MLIPFPGIVDSKGCSSAFTLLCIVCRSTEVKNYLTASTEQFAQDRSTIREQPIRNHSHGHGTRHQHSSFHPHIRPSLGFGESCLVVIVELLFTPRLSRPKCRSKRDARPFSTRSKIGRRDLRIVIPTRRSVSSMKGQSRQQEALVAASLNSR